MFFEFRCIYCHNAIPHPSDINKMTLGAIRCEECGMDFPVSNGIPNFLPDRSKMDLIRKQTPLAPILETKINFMELFQSISTYNQIHSEELYDSSLEMLEAIQLADLSHGQRIIDVGCGIGTLFRHLPKYLTTVGIDLSQTALQKIKEKHDNITLVQGLGEMLPFPSNFFDILFCMGSLEHFQSMEQGLKEFHRVLRPHGSAIVLVPQIGFLLKNAIYHYCFPNFHPLTFTRRLFIRFFRFKKLHIQIRDHYFSRNDAKNLFEKNGFSISNTTFLPRDTYTPLTYDFLFKLEKKEPL